VNIQMRELVGRTLRDTYTLDAYVAEGTFGALFRSQQPFLGEPVRRVAVKVSKAANIDIDKARKIFADVFLLAQAMDEMDDTEARGRLVHVYDAGLLPDLDNRAFVVMEYVEGTTLGGQFQSYKRVPWTLLLKWAKQIAQGLKGLHELVPAVLHRDLKPNNILLGVDRSVRIVDFGLAARLVQYGFVPGVAGTFAYMAPETMQGAGESVPASDVYSVGLILYEGLTGQHPYADLHPPLNLPEAFHRDWLVEQRYKLRVPAPTRLNSTVPPWLDSVILRCLLPEPTERYRNAAALLEALCTEGGMDAEQNVTDSLEEARRLRATGDRQAARSMIENVLGTPLCPSGTRFWMLSELGAILFEMREFNKAASHLVAAWQLNEQTVSLRTRDERADLLGRIAQAFLEAGNEYQAKHYQEMQDRERGGKPR